MLRAVEIYPWATLLTAVILWFVVAIPMDKIVRKQIYREGYAFYPILRGIALYRIVWGRGRWYFFSWIPIGGFVFHIVTYLTLAKMAKKGTLFGIGLLLYPFIFFHLLNKEIGEDRLEIGQIKLPLILTTAIPGIAYLLLLIVAFIISAVQAEQRYIERNDRIEAHKEALVISIASGEWGIIPITDGIEQTVIIQPYTDAEVEVLLDSLFLVDNTLDLHRISDLMDQEQVIFGGLAWTTLTQLMIDERVTYEDILYIAKTAHRQNNSHQMQLVLRGLAQETARELMGLIEEREWRRIASEDWGDSIRRHHTLSQRVAILTFLGELSNVRTKDFCLETIVDSWSNGIVYRNVFYRRATLGGVHPDPLWHVLRPWGVRPVEPAFPILAATGAIFHGIGAEIIGIGRWERIGTYLQWLFDNVSTRLSSGNELDYYDHTIAFTFVYSLERNFGAVGEAIHTVNGPRLIGISLETIPAAISFGGIRQDLGLNREDALRYYIDIWGEPHFLDSEISGYLVSVITPEREDTFQGFQNRLAAVANEHIDVLYEQYGDIFPRAFRVNEDDELYICSWAMLRSNLPFVEAVIQLYPEQFR